MDNEHYKEAVLNQMKKQTELLEKLLSKFDTDIFKKPTIKEITEYLKAKGSSIDPQSFYDYYESVGWKVGKKPMKDWHSAVATWEKREPKKKNSLERILHDGTKAINKFGTWVDANNPNVQINLSYYPELTKDV